MKKQYALDQTSRTLSAGNDDTDVLFSCNLMLSSSTSMLPALFEVIAPFIYCITV